MSSKIIILFLLFLSIFIRLYHFPQRINFGMEQGMTLSTTASYIYEKFSLLGMSNVARVTSDGHMVLINPLYNYSLIPLMLVFGKNPITLSYLAFFINIFTALALYFIAKKIFSKQIALFATFFFLFNLTMIEHSLTLWIHNIVPLIGILSFYLLFKWQTSKSRLVIFTLGVLSGLGYAMEYVYLLTLGCIGLYLLITSKHRLTTIFWYCLGCLLPQLPIILFDLRHDWYNLRTLWQYALDTWANPGQSRLMFYHFLQFYPLIFLAFGYLTDRLWRVSKFMGIAMITLYLAFTLTSPKLSLHQAIGTAPGMDTPLLIDFAKTISTDVTDPYNIVYLPQSEYRSHALRYLLTYVYQVPPMGIEAYPSAKTIYAVGQTGLDLLTDRPWEIGAFNPHNQEILVSDPNNLFSIYKLTQ